MNQVHPSTWRSLDPRHPARTSRTLVASIDGVNGFSKYADSGAGFTPRFRYPLVNNTLTAGCRDRTA